jgi:tetratricopeptide (TPR) repeat protein
MSGRYAEGAEALERVLTIKHSESALSNLATAYFNQRRFDQAIRGFQQAVDAGRSSYLIWGNLGDAYYWAPGKREHARPPYEQALKAGREYLADTARSPLDRAIALAYLANILPKLDRPDSAAAYLEQALTLSPDDYDVQYYAALVNRQLGRPAEALDWLARAIEGGYPRVWIRDSPVFDAWRDTPRFRNLVAADEGATLADPNHNQGG